MKGLTIGVFANAHLPEAFLDKATAAFNTFSGLAWRDLDEKRFYCGHYPAADTQAIMEFRAANLKSPVMIFLGNHDTELHTDDQQPFVLFDKQVGAVKIPSLVACIEGDYNGFRQTESAHTPEFFVRNHLINLMQERYLELNGDVGKLIDEMKNPMFGTSLKNLPTPPGRGSITLMADNGKIAAFSKTGAAFKWGWTSDALGHVESEMVAVSGVHKTEATPVKFGAKPAATAPLVEDIKNAEVFQPVLDMNAGPVANPKVITPATTATAITDDEVEIAPDGNGNQQSFKRFYRMYYPESQFDLPPGWKDGVAIRIKKSMVRPEHIRLIKTLSAGSVLVPKRDGNPKQTVQAKALGDIPKEKVRTVDDAMIVDDLEVNNALTIITSPVFQKFIVANGELMKDPVEWAKAEAKYPSFTERTGLTFKGDIIAWPPEAIDMFLKAFPKLGKLLVIELRSELAKTWGTITAPAKAPVEAPVTKTEPAKVAEPAKPAAAPKTAVAAPPPDEEGFQQVMQM